MPAWWPRRTSSFEIRMTCSAAPSSRLLATKSTFIWIPRPSGCGAQLALARLLEKKGATRGTAVEQEIERGEQPVGAHRAAKVQDQVCFRALDAELRAARERRADLERFAHEFERRAIEIHQARPAGLEDPAQRGGVGLEMLRLAVSVPQRGKMVRSPGAWILVIDHLVNDAFLLRALLHRHGEPARLAVEPDLAAVLAVAALELHVVQQDEEVHPGHAVQVTEPRQIVRLENRDDHRSSPRRAAGWGFKQRFS